MGLVDSIIGSAANIFATSKTNKTNLRINQQNIDAAKQMQQNQFNYNTEMWERTNAYNDPSAQMQRYRAAGLNPAMMMYGGNTSEASASSGSGGSAPSPIPAQPPNIQVSGLDSAPTDIAQTINNIKTMRAQRKIVESDASIKESEAKIAGINATMRQQFADQELRDLTNSANYKGELWNEKEWHNNINHLTTQEAIQTRKNDVRIGIADYAYKVFQTDQGKELLPFQKEEYSKHIANIVADTAVKYQSRNEIEERFKALQRENKVQGLTDEQVKVLSKMTYDMRRDTLRKSYWDAVKAENDATPSLWHEVHNRTEAGLDMFRGSLKGIDSKRNRYYKYSYKYDW